LSSGQQLAISGQLYDKVFVWEFIPSKKSFKMRIRASSTKKDLLMQKDGLQENGR